MDTILFLAFMVTGTFVLGLYDVLNKKYQLWGIDDQLFLGFSWMLAGILMAPIILVIGIPELRPGFWSALAATVAINLILQPLWFRSIKLAEASLVAPLRLITPPLVVVTGFLILGEKPTAGGIAGIFIIVAGLWFLFSSYEKGPSLSAAVRNMWTNQGVRFGLIGSVLAAFSFVFDKQAVITSSALFKSPLGIFLIGFFTLIWNILFRQEARRRLGEHVTHWYMPIVIVAVLVALGDFLTNQALNYSLAAYAAGLKRLWPFWTVILAGMFLKEGDFSKRLLATIIMLLGIAVIVIFG